MPAYPDLQLYIGGTWKSAEGQPVTMRVVDTPKGREALSINLA